MRTARHGGPPTVPPFAITRDDLLERLEDALRRPVVLLVAPAGYGKSVLLGQWARRFPARKVAWVALTDLDNDAVHLGRRLADALGTIDPDLGDAARANLHATTDSLGGDFLEQFTSDLEAAGEVTLVLEDLERLVSEPLRAELGLVAGRLPPGSHLVLSSRSDPPMALHRLRARDELAELRQDVLAMSAAETARLVQRLAGVELRADQARTLQERTEGWPVGVQLAALSLRSRDDVERFIDDFSGDDRHVADYLSGELLADLDPAERDFLVTTSVLDRLSGPACDALTGRRDGGTMLEDLERRALFLTPLDGRRDRYRYHTLFRDLLRYELRTTRPGEEEELHRRAARWCQDRGEITEAAGHLLAAEHWDGVVTLAEDHAREYFERGESNTVLSWFQRLPPEQLRHRPDLTLVLASLQIMGGQALAAEDHLARLLREQDLGPARAGMAQALRALLYQYHLDPVDALGAAREAEALLGAAPDGPAPVLGGMSDTASLLVLARIAGCRSELLQGRIDAARPWLARARGGSTFAPWTVALCGAEAQLEALAGRLQPAEDAAGRALRVAAEAGVPGHRACADAHLARGRVLIERRQFDEARQAFADGELGARANRRHVLLAVFRVEQAALLLATGRVDEGLALVQAGVEPGSPPAPPAIRARFVATEARLLAAAGRLDRAFAALAAYEGPPSAKLAAAEAAVAGSVRDLTRVRKVLADWPEQDATELFSSLPRRLWEAVLLDADGDRRGGLERMAEVVADAEPHGHLQLFLDGGRDAARILKRLYHDQPTPYLRRVVEVVSEGPPANWTPELVDQLSDRELAVLRYLPSRLSNPEIATKLYVSVNTVKTHVKAVYRKLGVTSRSEAVERAEELGLV